MTLSTPGSPRLKLTEREFHERWSTTYDPRIADARPPLLLKGHFQSERYFAHAAPVVRGAFKSAPSEVAEARRGITATFGPERPVIAVSLRTGVDYRDVGIVLPVEYYLAAVDECLARIGDAGFIVFGDVPRDAAGFSAMLASHAPAMSVATISPAAQLHLMATASAMVLSNSSFAWWGAWLGDMDSADPKTRFVLAPDPWVREPSNLVPERWITIRHSGFEVAGASEQTDSEA